MQSSSSTREGQEFSRPLWLGAEVTELRRYYNVCLVQHPYRRMDRSRTAAVSLRVSLAAQTLALERDGELRKTYSVSTSKHGAGELRGSYKTPRGRHVVRAKIGAGAPLNAVFRGRRPTGEIYSDALARAQPEPRLDIDAHLVAVGHRNRQQPAGPSRYNAPLHLYPRHARLGAARRAGIDRLHPHEQPRRRRAVRCGARRNDRGHRLTASGETVSLGPLMIDLRGTSIAPDEREWLQSPLVGGVILFTRNFASLEQLDRARRARSTQFVSRRCS